MFGVLSLIAAFLILMLPETLNKTLPQTIQDTEQMGLRWYVYAADDVIIRRELHLSLFTFSIRIRGTQRTSKLERKVTNKDDQSLNEIDGLSERL